MALSAANFIEIAMKAALRPAGDEEGGAVGEFTVSERIASGTGARMADDMIKDVRTLGAGASETINLQGLTNANGVTPTVAEIVAIGIAADPDNGAGIQIDDSPASPWNGLFRSSGATDDAELEFPPGAGMIAWCVLDPAFPVTAGSRQFLVTNLDGAAAASYTLFLLTRSA